MVHGYSDRAGISLADRRHDILATSRPAILVPRVPAVSFISGFVLRTRQTVGYGN